MNIVDYIICLRIKKSEILTTRKSKLFICHS